MSEQRIEPEEWAVIHQDRAKRGVALNAIDEADWEAVKRHRAEKQPDMFVLETAAARARAVADYLDEMLDGLRKDTRNRRPSGEAEA